MGIIPKPPDDIQQCRIYQRLLASSTPNDGCAEKAAVFIKAVSPLADLTIGGPFKEYTLHNRDHAKKLVHLAEYVISKDTLKSLSPLECLCIIYSAFLHDLGLSLTSSEREKIIKSADFVDSMRDWPALWDALSFARKRQDELKTSQLETSALEQQRLSIETEIYQLQEAGLSSYLRPLHATRPRYEDIIRLIKHTTHRTDLFNINDVSFEDFLIDINISHNQDVGVLAEVHGPYDEKFPRDLSLGGQILNVQFVASVLRIVDILDFDRERTPIILFESLGLASRSLPGSDVSLKEWQKNMAVHDIAIDEDEIVVSADCEHPAIEKTIRDFCQIMEREVRDTLAILRHNKKQIADDYQLDLPVCFRPRIRAKNYSYSDVSFQLNQSAISSLLMGDRLYSNLAAPLRELIQNSIDACSARVNILRDPRYVPIIAVSTLEDEAHRHWLQVDDNGIGMDDGVIAKYFLQIGNSYYNSPEFERLYRQSGATDLFVPVAKFGIGLASVFMIADALETTTRCISSPRQDYTSRLIRIERMGALAYLTEIPERDYGTTVKVRLRPQIDSNYTDFAIRALDYLKEVVVRPAFDIKINITEDPYTITHNNVVHLKNDAHQYLDSLGIEAVTIDLQRWSENLSGTIILFFSKNAEGMLSHQREGRRIRISTVSRYGILDPNKIVEDYRGNRLTVNGFKMSLKKQSDLFRFGGQSVAAIVDVDVSHDKHIEFNVSREKIALESSPYLRGVIRSTVIKYLTETQTMQRLDANTKEFIETIDAIRNYPVTQRHYMFDEKLTPELLTKVYNAIPKDEWPLGVHKQIASELDITNGLAWRAIDALLAQGNLIKPKRVKKSEQPL